jgi:hypothetical protein
VAEGVEEGNNVRISATPITVAPIYTATISAQQDTLIAGQPVNLSGQLVRSVDGVGVAGKPVTVVFLNSSSGQQFSRKTVSGTNGTFSLSFTPTLEQAGAYGIAARYSDNPDEDRQPNGDLIPEDSFRVQGLAFTPGAAIVSSVAEGATLTGAVTLRNLGPDRVNTTGLSLSGAPSGWQINLAGLPESLAAGASTSITYSFRAPDASLLYDAFDVVATGSITGLPALTARQSFAVSILPNRPVLSVDQAQRSAAMLLGQRTLQEVRLTNSGNASTGPINVALPGGVPWLSLYGPSTLAPLAPGASTSIILALDPAAGLTLATYQASIGFLDESHPADSLVVPFNFRAVSSATGSVQVSVYDDYSTAPLYPTVASVKRHPLLVLWRHENWST